MRRILVFLFSVFVLTAFSVVVLADSSYVQIDQETAKQMMEKDDGHIIVDVRRQEEYDEGHIPGAILIPNETIISEKPDELSDPDQTILIYCRSGRRSKEAAQKLADMGYTNIYEFGGIIDWTGNIVSEENFNDQTEMALEDYLEHGDEMWFLTGKNKYTVQAMMVSKETSFHNELEAADYTVTDDGITVILKGSFDEMWASKLDKVISTYTKLDGSALCKEDFAEKDLWIEIVTKPEPNSYYAIYVPLNISVIVETAWGDVLHTNLSNAPHGDGDYLMCRKGEDGNPDLSDVWVLNGVVFPEYYAAPAG